MPDALCKPLSYLSSSYNPSNHVSATQILKLHDVLKAFLDIYPDILSDEVKLEYHRMLGMVYTFDTAMFK